MRFRTAGVAPMLMVVVGALVIAKIPETAAQAIANSEPRIVRHRLDVAIKLDPSVFNSGNRDQSPDTATIMVRVRISDAAKESQFYGDVATNFVDFNPSQGSPWQKVWEDPKCHHERGIPKTTVISVEGSMSHGANVVPVSAHPRRLGLRVPADEITTRKKLPGGTTRTELSRIHAWKRSKATYLWT